MNRLEEQAQASAAPFTGDGLGYFVRAQAHAARQWTYYVQPLIGTERFGVVLELACGHGRFTGFLRERADQVIAADVNEDCLRAAEERHGTRGLVYTKLDGYSFKGVPSGVVDLLFSFDSAVHFGPDVLASYVRDVARVLRPGGRALIHHANRALRPGEDFRAAPHWRNDMTAERFYRVVEEAGLRTLRQWVIGWDESLPPADVQTPCLDCITVFERPR